MGDQDKGEAVIAARTYKEEIYDMCKQVATKFDGVTFSNGSFRVKIANFAKTEVKAGLTFKYGVADINPYVTVILNNYSNLIRKYTGMGDKISMLIYQDLRSELQSFPKEKAGFSHIVREYPKYLFEENRSLKNHTLVKDVPQLLEDMVDDGVRMLHKLYDFSSERKLLENMPPQYDPPPLDIPMPNYVGVPYTEYSRGAGIAMCLVRMSLGDFDFIDFYESDKFNPFMYKTRDRLDKLKKDVPELKRRYEETGKIY